MIEESHEHDRHLDEAADWHVRLLAPDATEADWLAFEQWLSADALNQAAYDRVERTWALVEDARPDVNRPPAEPTRDSNVIAFKSLAPDPAAMGPLRTRRNAIAAGIAALLVTGGLLGPRLWPAGTVYQTAKGETRTITLADGSILRLNSGSRVRVDLEKNARHVIMGDAEVSFDVAKDPSRPFYVAAGDRQVRVVGTEFNILNHQGRTVVTLRRGVIDVQPRPVAASVKPVRLAPGEQLTYRTGTAPATLRQVNADAAFAWQKGQLVYQDSSLADIVSDLNRYFPTPIHLDPKLAALTFSGVLSVDSEQAVVERLEAFLPVVAEHSQQGFVLRAR